MSEGNDWKNKLYFGDNLYILREHVLDESVDLIYLDPPFNSKATYNVLFAEKNGSQSTAQITAFEDTWHWGQETEDIYSEVVQRPGRLADLIAAFRSFLGENGMMAYLVMMSVRLAELHRVLRPTGGVYLHCDPTASHYLKLIMDSIFGAVNFKNEIVWSYKRYTAKSLRFQRLHDIILFYGKSGAANFNTLRVEYGSKSGKADSHYKQDENGRWYRDQKRAGEAPYKIYLSEEGRRLGDVWEISLINASAKERLGYPTQKPEALLERIISASSNEGDIVLDPFCGSGTTIAVAERLNRRWIGIDITHLAISLMKTRLQDTFEKDLSPYEVIGDPKDLAGAKALAEENRFQFEWWAVGKVGAYPAQDKKKSADSGIDGIIKFFDDNSKKPKKIIVQVKSGKVQPSHIRGLIGVVKREKAVIGAFITLNPPTKLMETEAIKDGYYVPEYLGKEHKYPAIQILTVEQILAGNTIKYPRLADATSKKAVRKTKTAEEQADIFSVDTPQA